MEDKKKVVRYKLVRHKWPDEIEAEKARRNRRITVVVLCIVVFILGYLSSCIINQDTAVKGSAKNSEKFDTIYDILTQKWYFGKDIKKLDEKLLDAAINGMVDSGKDVHTTYMDKSTSQRFISSLEGHFVGIGVQYYNSDGKYVIEKVFKNSPAEKAGIIKGDIISKVDGASVEGMDIDEVAKAVKGEAGTKVVISVIRENKEIVMDVIRNEVNDSVFGEVKDGVGVLEITSFSETSGKEVGVYLKEFKDQNAGSIIIDLRDNGGGYLTAAMDIASYFLPQGATVMQQEDKEGNITTYKTEGDVPVYTFDNIIVLVNQDTASASEVLSAFLREQLDAKLIGTTTYGKGTVQITLPFDDGSSLKYTTAQWLTSKGKKINGKGLKPDVAVYNDEALTTTVPSLKEGTIVKVDSVSSAAKTAQIYLKFLGYGADRNDEYFSYASSEALKQYQQDNGLEVTGSISDNDLSALLSSCSVKWHDEKSTLDQQMIKAMEAANGR